MSLMTVTIILAAISGLLAIIVGAVYWNNHRQIRSPFTMALLFFAFFLVVHNALLIYHLTTMMATFTEQAQTFLVAEGVLQVAALAALAYASLR